MLADILTKPLQGKAFRDMQLVLLGGADKEQGSGKGDAPAVRRGVSEKVVCL